MPVIEKCSNNNIYGESNLKNATSYFTIDLGRERLFKRDVMSAETEHSVDPLKHVTSSISNIFFLPKHEKNFTSGNKEDPFDSDGVFSLPTLGCVRGEKRGRQK